MNSADVKPASERRARLLGSWTTVVPILAAIALALTWGSKPAALVVAIIAVVLIGAIAGAVHHAEVIAHRVGEPFGSLVLAVAVTVIEVGLIVSLMAAGGEKAGTLARDTVFAAAMITMNGIVGLSLFVGARRYGTAVFNAEGSGAALATVASLVEAAQFCGYIGICRIQGELQSIVAKAGEGDPAFRGEVRLGIVRDPFENLIELVEITGDYD